MNKKPMHTHDCDDCVFLDNFLSYGTWYDLYVHWDGSQKTVTARYGNGGPEYNSGLALAAHLPQIYRALMLAYEKGIIPEKVLYPLSVRKAFRDSPVRIREFGHAISDEVSSRMQGSYVTENSRDIAADMVRQIWMRYYEAGHVNVDADDMPEFTIKGSDGTWLFEWNDRQIAVDIPGYSTETRFTLKRDVYLAGGG